jgi:hypothetical protein
MLLMLALVLGVASEAVAVLDFQVATGAYNVPGNWIDYVSGDTSTVPTDGYEAVVRNGGTLNITAADGNASADLIRIGAGPLGTDPVGPPFYGGTGTLNFTGGNILGDTFGPRLNVGQRDSTNDINYTGIVNQSGGKISLNTPLAFLVVGPSGTTPTPTSVYNLSGGTIGVTAGSGNTNNGINVRNGTFNMTGGSIISDDNPVTPSQSQRAMTLSTASGPAGAGNENLAYANFSGGTVYTYGGFRVGNSANAKAYVTISGNADLHFRAVDMQLASNATNSYGQVDMSGGSLKVGDPTISQQRRLIIGDSGTGVFNLSGGTVNLYNSLVVANNSTSKGTLYQTGGTLTVVSFEMNRNGGTWDLNTENATAIIDGPSAVFTQQNFSSTVTGQTTIGKFGNGRFEVRQGQANLREILPSENPQSRATIAVTGGILRVQDALNRTNTDAATIPNIILTGGELEFTTPGGIMQWQAGIELQGTDFDPKPLAVLQTNIGNETRPGNFALNTGSVWDLDIASNTLFGGADWVAVNNGTVALNGGVLNIHQIGGYTPVAGDTVTIARDLLGSITLDSGAVTVSNPNWVLQTNATNKTIELKYSPSAGLPGDYNNNGTVDAADYALWRKNPSAYGGTPAGYNTWRTNFGRPPGSGSSLDGGGAVPEPSTIVLVGLFASVSLASRPARCRKRYGAS